jgi:hypothetical protein
MPTNITDTAAFTSPVVVPADGEGATSASLLLGLQPLANRTAFLKTFVDNGIVTIRTVADFTALSALTGMADGEVAYVVDYGLYKYDAGSSATPASVWILTSAAGRWFSSMLGVLDNNIPTIDPVTTRITAGLVPNRLVAYYSNVNGAGVTATAPSADYTLYSSRVLTVTDIEAGDFLIVDVDLHLESGASNDVVAALFYGTTLPAADPSPGTYRAETLCTTGSSTPVRFSMSTLLTPSAAASTEFGIYIKPLGADDAILSAPFSFRIQHWRP